MFSIGQRVKAQWTNGAMYGARITNFNGAQYEVAWDDGSAPLWLSPHQIQHDVSAPAGGGGQFAIGQRVKAQWTNGAMYGARITNFNGAQYEVAWDDGSAPMWLSPHQIQHDAGAPAGGGAQFQPGQRVKAQWTNGGYYGARINNFNGAQYEVLWDDGSAPMWLSPHQIQHDTGGGGIAHTGGFSGGGAAHAQFAVGQHVRAQWTDGNWFGARVLGFNGSQYQVGWDDGAAPSWLAAHQVQADNGVGGMQIAQTSGGMQIAQTSGVMMGPGQTYAIGQRVLAQYSDGSWYGARVNSYNGNQYEIAWDDGAPNQWLGAHQVRGA